MKLRIRRPSPALFVAILALVVAMSGSAYALQRAQSGDTLIAKRSLSGNRLRLNTVTGSELANLTWHNLVLKNDWSDFWAPVGSPRPPGYAIDAQGVVHLRGAVTLGEAFRPGFHDFAVLPKAVRPAVKLYLPAVMVAGTPGAVTIAHSGEMDVQEATDFMDAEQFTSLEGITYSLH